MARQQVRRKTSIGGQALIEGVMMRGPERTAMAVRHVDGTINTDSWETSGKARPKILKAPFIRGVFNFIDSMSFGYKCLMKSVEMSGMEDEIVEGPPAKKAEPDAKPEAPAAPENAEPESEPAAQEARAEPEMTAPVMPALPDMPVVAAAPPPEVTAVEPEPAPEPESAPAPEEQEEKEGGISKALMNVLMVISSLLGVALAVVLFMWLPTFLSALARDHIPFFQKLSENEASWRLWRAAFEGIIRIVLFVGYILLVSLMKDIRRVFMYHGAEHKTIFCYEKEQELTVENVRGQTRFHPRCGTSFMIFMLLVGIVVGMFIPPGIPVVLRTAIKLLTIPLVVGIGYELIKLAGRSDNLVVRILSAPGLWLQRITTKEPTDDMIEVAIKAFGMVVPEDPGADRL